MKIALFGDSHADNFYESSVNNDISWAQILAKKYDLYSFAKGGSSLFFAYKNIIEQHHLFDKIILFITSPGRLYLDPHTYPGLNPSHNHIPSYHVAKSYIKVYEKNRQIKKLYESVCDYFLYVKNDASDNLFHTLMLEKIKKIRSDAILIDVVKFGFQNDTDFQFFDKTPDEIYPNYWDLRHCHFSKEKHIILAELLDKALEHDLNDIDYSELLNVKPSKKFEDYFLHNSNPHPELINFKKHINEINRM
jgi:hypothetical protein